MTAPALTPPPAIKPPSPPPRIGAAALPPPTGAVAQAPRPTVSPARARHRHVAVVVSFLLAVVLPGIVAAVYLTVFAADQYASKVGFAVRREDAGSALELLGGLTQVSGSSSSDTDILFEFIRSQKLVSDMNEAVDLYAIWSRPKNDPLFTLAPDATLEELVEHWNKMVRLSFGRGSGLLEVEVRAFDPADAQRIAQTLFDMSAQKINELSAIAREDAIRYRRSELDDAVERLKAAREKMTRFRNDNQFIDPGQALTGQTGLLNNLQNQQAAAMIDIDMLREISQKGDPRLVQAERKLGVIENRIAAERQKLGLGGEVEDGSKALADIVGEFEGLTVDREFAERAYVSALTAYDTAMAESQRKTRYLAAYMQPTLAQSPEYPHRRTIWALLMTLLFTGWAIVVLVAYSLRDRR